MSSGNQKHILVAVLDWGLGHATRSIPVINCLLSNNCIVIIAGNGPSFQLLKLEFKDLIFHELPSYNITYPTHRFFFWHLFLLSPRVFKAIRSEKREMEELVRKYEVDAIISDNRYGCYSVKVPSILITHQLNIQLPVSLRWARKLIDYLNHQLIKKFDVCWVPDYPDSRLTNKLTRTSYQKVIWIGVLSRLTQKNPTEKNGSIVGLISGPEPQREIFEKLLIKELKKTDQPCIVIRGLPHRHDNPITDNNITLINHVPASELEVMISNASIFISRSGYSTIMDLQTLGKKNVIFVPTPGQTEQEYLAVELKKRKIAFSQSQAEFDLSTAIQKSKDFIGFDVIEHSTNLLDQAIKALIYQL